jgi:hypothetical protein
LHAGFAGVQFASLVQPRVQTWFFVSHTPFTPVQSAFVSHCTHVNVGTSQTGVPPVHAILSVPVHWTHAPCFGPAVVTHAGSAAA